MDPTLANITAEQLQPLGVALAWRSELLGLHAVAFAALILACLAMPAGILLLVREGRAPLAESGRLVGSLTGFFLASAAAYLSGLLALWWPWHVLHGILQALTAGLALWVVVELIGLLARHRRAWRSADAVPERVSAADPKATQTYFEIATRNAQISVFAQDRELRYLWLHNPRLGYSEDELIGRSDLEVLPLAGRDRVVEAKLRVLDTGAPETFEIELPEGDSTSWFRFTTTPLADEKGEISQILSTAVDITRAKRLEAMRRDLTDQLSESIQRLAIALRASGVFVFSQDRDLRYLWVSSPDEELGLRVGDLETETSRAGESRLRSIALKRRVMETAEGGSDEIVVGEGDSQRWFELNVEPARAPDETIVGVTCALTDITDQKRHERQMRVVMRELSHRSKNLMAVIQAVARQTARNVDKVEDFIEGFVQRLRAIASAQDLIVASDWGPTSLRSLVEGQLAHYRPDEEDRILIEGPPVLLSASATQALALALHELATNAIKYGALSTEAGRLEVAWSLVEDETGSILRLLWRERGGPSVERPGKRGFGRMVIEDNLASALSAKAELHFTNEGLDARFEIPFAKLTQ